MVILMNRQALHDTLAIEVILQRSIEREVKMDSAQQILQQVERLSLSQLEAFHDFIATRAYKQEDRPPTPEEIIEVRSFLDTLLEQGSDEEEPPTFDTNFPP
jgi:hypothetical protein